VECYGCGAPGNEVATVNEENDGSSPVETPDEGKVVNELMQSLPDELSGEQRDSVEEVIGRHEAIFSKHEYDIGRTSLVEYRIDTCDHRPIRIPLRRHPFWEQLADKWRK